MPKIWLLHTRLPDMPVAYVIQRDESVLEERLRDHGEVLALQVLVLVGEPGEAALGMGREAAQPPGKAGQARLGRRGLFLWAWVGCVGGQMVQRSCFSAPA